MKELTKQISVKESFKDKEYLAFIKRFLHNHGFCCEAYKPSYLQRRITVRLRANQFKSFADYYKLLKRNPQELKLLIDALTINVTGFFRDADVYRTFEEKIVLELLDSSRKKRLVRIWSAGCSTGEEPYSIVMLMLETLGLNDARHLLSVFATDIDERSLVVAHEGVYSPKELEKLSDDLIQKYFVFNENYHFKQELKSFVKFKRLDLLTDKGIKLCDVIFCRNVLIYFNREEQERTLEMFYESLRPGGYLVLGKTEILPFGFSDKFHSVDRKGRLYKKIA